MLATSPRSVKAICRQRPDSGIVTIMTPSKLNLRETWRPSPSRCRLPPFPDEPPVGGSTPPLIRRLARPWWRPALARSDGRPALAQPPEPGGPHRLPAEDPRCASISAEGELIGGSSAREKRAVVKIPGRAAGDEGGDPGGRGRPLLPARGGGLRRRGRAPRWPICRGRARGAPAPSPCRWRGPSS